MKMKGLQMQDFSAGDLLYLMDIYITEWRHRRKELWSQVFKYFYATIIVLFLPNISVFVGIELSRFPTVFFPVIALLLSFVFLYVALSFTVRLEVLKQTYLRLIQLLPTDLQRETVKNSGRWYSRILGKSSAYVHTFMMFIGLFTMSIVMIIYNLTK